MKTHASVVVVGGGVVGVSILYHLAKLGVRDAVLLERTELTAGSTWHAAGLLPLFNMSYVVGQLHKYSVDLYKALEAETGQPVSFHQTGNLRLAATRERMDEYHAYCGTANTIGVPFELISPKEIKELWPLASIDGLVGALYHPQDGHVAPVDVVMAMAKGARSGGGTIYQNTEMLSARPTATGEWALETSQGPITAEKLVLATGNYARQTAHKVGLELPVIPVEHQYILTEEVPELVQRHQEGLPELAVLRESDASYYLREERRGYILGPYEKGAVARFADGVPKNFGKELFAGELERLLPHVEAAVRRVPSFERAGIKDIVNGPIAYTPDGNPILGEAPGLHHLYLAEGFSFGITAAGGAGKVLAELIVEGEASVDMLPLDPRRFGAYINKNYTVRKNVECYEHVFVIHYPHEERPAARPCKTSPVHDRLAARGAVWGQRYGWERPNFFIPGAPAEERRDHWSFRRPDWFQHVKRECHACRDGVGLIDLTSFSKFEARGPGVNEWLESLFANAIPKKLGAIRLAHALFPGGGVRSEFTLYRTGSHAFFLVCSGAAESYDYDWLVKALPSDNSVQLRNVTTSRGCFVLVGPKSRALLATLADGAVDNEALSWLNGKTLTVGLASHVHVLRVNFVGELGYELHHPIENQLSLFQSLEEAGAHMGEKLAMVGMRAMDSMRIEKSYRMWGAELTRDYSPLEAGLDRFVRLNKTDYPGRQALEKQGRETRKAQFVTMEVSVEEADCLGNEPIYAKGNKEAVCGRVTSGGYGHRLEKSLALGYIHPDLARVGQELDIRILGRDYPARVIAESPYDPENLKLRG